MADVRDIDDVPDLVSVAHHHATQDVLEDIGSQIADMRVVINRGPAAIHADLAGVN